MRTSDLAPLVLDTCLLFLETRPTGTRYHPKDDEFVIDASLMARIIRHDGDLRSQVTQSEQTFFSRLMTALIKQNIVPSVTTNEKYEVLEDRRFNRFQIIVNKKRRLWNV